MTNQKKLQLCRYFRFQAELTNESRASQLDWPLEWDEVYLNDEKRARVHSRGKQRNGWGRATCGCRHFSFFKKSFSSAVKGNIECPNPNVWRHTASLIRVLYSWIAKENGLLLYSVPLAMLVAFLAKYINEAFVFNCICMSFNYCVIKMIGLITFFLLPIILTFLNSNRYIYI